MVSKIRRRWDQPPTHQKCPVPLILAAVLVVALVAATPCGYIQITQMASNINPLWMSRASRWPALLWRHGRSFGSLDGPYNCQSRGQNAPVEN
ncbi:MAG: hypothetical protein R2932_50405 [Caldilineaceae bacterium]